jgi:hypothetical protein
MYQIDAYLSQIWYVVPMVRIRYYLRNIYSIMLKWLCDADLPEEYDEDEDTETRKADELYKTQLEAIKQGIQPPKGWA